MLIEEEPKSAEGDINPDVFEAVFEEEVIVDEEIPLFGETDNDGVDEIDIAFQANDEGYW